MFSPEFKNLCKFKNISDIILVNRIDSEIDEVKDKCYTRDLFYKD